MFWKLLHAFEVHKWTNWSEVIEVETQSVFFKEPGAAYMQKRKCEICGAIEYKKVL